MRKWVAKTKQLLGVRTLAKSSLSNFESRTRGLQLECIGQWGDKLHFQCLTKDMDNIDNLSRVR